MLEMRLGDGRAFVPEEATWEITLPDGSKATWADVEIIRMIEPEYGTTDGRFGGGMPIRVLGFHDPSDLSVEIPLPIEAAREIGDALASKEIEIARAIPSSLIVARRKL